MAETPFNMPMREPVTCPRCGRLFEKPITVEVGGEKRYLPGHQVGDPKTCIPLAGGKLALDARERKRMRERL